MYQRTFFKFLLLFTIFITWGNSRQRNEVDAAANTTVLYNAALGGKPDSQEFVYLTDPFFGASATNQFAGSVTVLDTTAVESDKAGYFAWRDNNPTIPVLDTAEGFQLDFTVQSVSESHSKNKRSGFSVLVVADNLTALEIAIWQDEIWVQEGNGANLFTHAEGAAYNTTASLAFYSLLVDGANYTLKVNNNTLLTGAMRSYTDFGGFPYTQKNFVFLGDNTTSAKGETKLSYVAISTGTAVPPTQTATATQTAVATHTATATATQTAVPPTQTATATQTAVATNTATATATKTAVPPTQTATATQTAVATSTASATASATATPTTLQIKLYLPFVQR